MTPSAPAGPERSRHRLVLLACVLLGASAGALWAPDVDDALRERLPEPTTGGGFATSATCQACHPDQYDSWHRSYHRTMTQVATQQSVLGRFDGVVLEDRGQQWRLERRDDEFWVEMPDPLWFNEPVEFMRRVRPDWPEEPPRFEARVVMTTGSHHMQNYWVRRPVDAADPLGPDSGALVQVPWVWLIAEGRWIPNQDSFLRPPAAAIQGAMAWNGTCSQCHSVGTEPRIVEHLGRYETRTVELGVACEACHGPAAEHVRLYRSPVRRYLRYLSALANPDAADPSVVHPEKLNARRSSETCAQCHSFGDWTDQRAYGSDGVPFRPGDDLGEHRSVYRYAVALQSPLPPGPSAGDPTAFEGSFWSDGTIRVAGREYNGLLEDVHLDESDLTCLTCHSMHGYEAPEDQLDPQAAGDRSCLGCHEELATDVTGHTHHRPESTGSACLNCHMPHTTYGLFSAMRSHRIDSPRVGPVGAAGRPNACNLCHLDQTLAWSNRHLSEWYGQPLVDLGEDEQSIAGSVLWALKGDAAQRAVIAWHLGWDDALRASDGRWTAAYLAQLLTDPYAAVRQVAFRAFSQMPGFSSFDYDYLAPREELEERATAATELWLTQAGEVGAPTRLLLTESGAPNVDAWLRLLAERDQRPLAIVE